MSYNKKQIKIRDLVFSEITARYIERYGAVLQDELLAAGESGIKGRVRGTAARTPKDRYGGMQPNAEDGDGDEGDGGNSNGGSGGWEEVGTAAQKRQKQRKRPPANEPGRRSTSVSELINDIKHTHMIVSAETEGRITRGLVIAKRKSFALKFLLAAAIIICCAVIAVTTGLYSRLLLGWQMTSGPNIFTGGTNSGATTGADALRTAGTGQGAQGAQANQGATSGSGGSGSGGAGNAADGNAVTGSGGDGGSAGDGNAAGSRGSPGNDAVIPLDMPEMLDYEIVSVIQDNGRTIYFITEKGLDNIVVSLRRGALTPAETAGLPTVRLSGAGWVGGAGNAAGGSTEGVGISAYLLYNADYSLLLFDADGIIYELTCRYNANTLTGFLGFEGGPYARSVFNGRGGGGGFAKVSDKQLSDIPLKADTASYTDIRRHIFGGAAPPAGAVVADELINYIRAKITPEAESGTIPGQNSQGQADPAQANSGQAEAVQANPELADTGQGETAQANPEPADPSQTAQPPAPAGFATRFEIGLSPFDPSRVVAYAHIASPDINWDAPPPASVTFLINSSGSMFSFDKMPLIRDAVIRAAEKMGEWNRVSILTYDDEGTDILVENAGIEDITMVRVIMDSLTVGGNARNENGLSAAYSVARRNFIGGGANYIVAVTDCDDNFGAADRAEAARLIARGEEDGVGIVALGIGAVHSPGDNFAALGANGGLWGYAQAGTLADTCGALLDVFASGAYQVSGGATAQVEFNPANVAEYRLIGYGGNPYGEAGGSGAINSAGASAAANGAPGGATSNNAAADSAFAADAIYAGNEIILLYELALNTPLDSIFNAGGALPGGQADADPADTTTAATGAAATGGGTDASQFADELFELRIYEQPDGEEEKTTAYAKAATFKDMRSNNSADFILACSAAAFADALTGGRALSATAALAESLAEAGQGENADSQRTAYLDMIRRYRTLTE